MEKKTLKSFAKGTTTSLTMARLRDIVDNADLSAAEQVQAIKSELREYQFYKTDFTRRKTDSVYGTCYYANTKCSLGPVTLVKPIRTWHPNSRWQILDKNCIYLRVPVEWQEYPKWISVPYKKYKDKAKAFDASMKALIKAAKKELWIK